MRPALSLAGLLLLAVPASAAEPDYARDVVPLLRKYCHGCHGDRAKPKGGLSLTTFATAADAAKATAVWRDVFDSIRAGDMPPADKPQPTAEERKVLLEWLEAVLATPDLKGARDPGKPVLRRLTRLEYNNTVRDLLGLKTDLFMFPERLPFRKAYFDPSKPGMPKVLRVEAHEYGQKVPALLDQGGIPGDNRAEHGFANRGDALNFSPLLLEKYLAVADDIVNSPKLASAAPRLAGLMPGATTGVAPGPKDAVTAPAVGELAPANNVTVTAAAAAVTLDAFRKTVKERFAGGTAGVFAGPPKGGAATVPGDGKHSLVVGLNGGRSVVLDPSEDLWLVGFATAVGASEGAIVANKEKNEKKYQLALRVDGGAADERVTEVGLVVLGRKGQSGEVKVTANYTDGTSTTLSHAIPEGAGTGNTFFSFAAPPNEGVSAIKIDGTKFTGDYVLIDDLAFVTSGSPSEPKAVAKPEPAERLPATRAELKKRFAAFLERAFRRPVPGATVELYLRPYDAAKKAGTADADALKMSLTAVLASPEFLFLAERYDPKAGAVRPLDDFELASRLSYFLWASAPDDELLALARAGKLRDPAALEAQARRMLSDPKARELSESFAAQWLRLNELWAAQPDRQQFKTFYAGPQGKGTLHADMVAEALLLFETVLVEDRSVLDFVDADYGYVNKRLLEHYGLERTFAKQWEAAGLVVPPGLTGPELNRANAAVANTWLRVKWPDRTRGGVLTCGAVLTLTSLPARTSPVKRGAWVLEAVFNRPPPEPTVVVPPLDERRAAEAGQTVRQKLELHRKDPNCAGCHAKTDPPGFALENFDPVGRWRDADDGLAIDSTGATADGTTFSGPAGFKDVILKDRAAFARAFTEHLLSYALGRKLEHFDAAAVNEIVAAAAKGDYKLSRLVVGVVQSYPFRHTRNTPPEATK